jgi:site-specific recombinase XerD
MANTHPLLRIFRPFATVAAANVSSLVEHYLLYTIGVERRSQKTYDNRKWILEPFFNRLGIPTVESITLIDVDMLFMKRGTEVKESTLSVERQVVKSFFAYCADYMSVRLKFNYQEIRRTKPVYGRVTTFTPTQVSDVISQVANQQDRLIIALLFETGMRIGELADLERSHVDGTKIMVRGKGLKDRLVFMSVELSRAMQQHIQVLRANEKVFQPLQHHSNHRNDRYTTCTLRMRIKKEFDKSGYDMKPHQLRHSFAVNWLNRGGDIRSLQIILGHASIETTMSYLQLSDDHIKQSYNRIQGASVLT